MIRTYFAPTALTTVLVFAACGPTISGSHSSSSSLFATSGKNFRVSLTDAPNDQLSSVIVNIKSAQLRVSKGGREAWINLSQNLGPVDLLTLQNGVTLPLADLILAHDIEVSQFRLVLENEGNYIIKSDGSRCDLKTPSAEKTGIKFIVNQPVKVESGFNYALVADFDSHKSIVLTGNGGCLLKPVLKLKSLDRLEIPTPEATPAPEATPTPEAPPVPESTQVTDGNGWDSTTESTTEPVVISPIELPTYFE